METTDYQSIEANLGFLLRCNLAPSAFEALQISDLILRWEAELSSLDPETAEAQALTTKPGTSRQIDMLRKLAAFRAVLSPVRRIPPELWIEIFLHCPENPWRLCILCSNWRKIAMATPGLWNTFHVYFNHLRYDSQVAQMNTRLDRARGSPLSIRTILKGGQTLPPIPIPDTILSHLRFLQHLDLTFPPAYLRPLFEMPAGSLEILETLTIFIEGIDALPPLHLKEPPTVFTLAPRLKRFSWGSRFSEDIPDLRVLNLPWSQLTSLRIDDPNISCSACCGILEQCVNLVELKIDVWLSPDTDDIIPLHLTTLPNLRKLFCYGCDYRSVASIFGGFAFPALKDLTFKYMKSSFDVARSHMMMFKSRSHLDLEKLTLASADIEPEDLVHFLQNMPSITELDIDDDLDDCLLDALTYYKTNIDFIAPNLKILCTSFEVTVDRDLDNAFADMVESRWWPNVECEAGKGPISRIQEVMLRVDDTIDYDTEALLRLRQFRDEGLELFEDW